MKEEKIISRWDLPILVNLIFALNIISLYLIAKACKILSVEILDRWDILIIIVFLFLVTGLLGVEKFLYVAGPLFFLENSSDHCVLVLAKFGLELGVVFVLFLKFVEKVSGVREEKLSRVKEKGFCLTVWVSEFRGLEICRSGKEVSSVKSIERVFLNNKTRGVSSEWAIFLSILGIQYRNRIKICKSFLLLKIQII